MVSYNPKLKNTARTLRKHMTDSEIVLWSRVRRKQLKGYQFYRQKVLGSYIVDFYCPASKLVIEVDGSQHAGERQNESDKRRDAYLAGLGFQVVRYWSWDIMNDIDAIVSDIWIHLR